METKRKVQSLGFLRGLAVLSVCFCHFGNPLAHNNIFADVFNIFHDYGQFGVHIFFVISGFVIPLSMEKARYSLKYYFNFLAKRALRLHPPYLVALAITLMMIALANHAKHVPFSETPLSIVKSLFYIKAPSENPVFWTLRIEAEYYLFMGLYFAALQRFRRPTLLISIPLLMFASQTELIKYCGLFEYIIFFLIGTVGFLLYNTPDKNVLFERIALIALVVFSFTYDKAGAAVAALFTVLFILFYHGKIYKVFDFYGELSYSIYLIHFPIGIKFINVSLKYIQPQYYWVLFIAANTLILVLAVIFWKYIEKPSAELSNKVKYGAGKPLANPVPLTA